MERKQKITWDEEAIAEHDKERGSRQKIDEAPTPYRYGSESDQSEGESGDHDASKGTTSNQNEPEANKGQTTKEFEDNRVLFRSPAGSHNVISDSWEALNAKLHYEKHLQDLKVRGNNDAIQRREFYQSGTSSNINSSSNNNNNNNSSSNNNNHPTNEKMNVRAPTPGAAAALGAVAIGSGRNSRVMTAPGSGGRTANGTTSSQLRSGHGGRSSNNSRSGEPAKSPAIHSKPSKPSAAKYSAYDGTTSSRPATAATQASCTPPSSPYH